MGGPKKYLCDSIWLFPSKGVGEYNRTALNKCLEEMKLFSQAKGANSSTFLGLSGVGISFQLLYQKLEKL